MMVSIRTTSFRSRVWSGAMLATGLLALVPVTLTQSATFTARAWHPDYVTSAPTAAAYTITVAAPTFTPTLTLQLFAQPFVASGAYSSFREFAAPRTLARGPAPRPIVSS